MAGRDVIARHAASKNLKASPSSLYVVREILLMYIRTFLIPL